MYDIAVIGSGAAGIACAKQAVLKGLKTALIEADKNNFGGTCLNNGCIPTKFFINQAKHRHLWDESLLAKKNLIEKIKTPLLDFLQKQGVSIKFSNAKFIDSNTLDLDGEKLSAKNIVIATGSLPKTLVPDKRAISPDQAFNLPVIGENILIIGAGYIGIEFACMLKAFGKKVTVIEKQPRILPFMDSYLSNRLGVILNKKGINVMTGKSLTDIDADEFDRILVSIGRQASVSGLNLEAAGVKLNQQGFVVTDGYMRTSQPNIYACGDVNGRKMLAYTAEYQGKIAIDTIFGGGHQENYAGVPECVFSTPQIAMVGMLEDQAKALNINYRVIKSNFLKFSSAYVYDDTDGFLQILVDERNKIIGAGIISQSAAELISIFALAIKNYLTLADLSKCLFIHPSLSEILAQIAGE